MLSIIYVDLNPVRNRRLEAVLEENFYVHTARSAFALIEFLNSKPLFDLVVYHGILSQEDTLQALQKTAPYIFNLSKPSVIVSDTFSFSEKKIAVKEGLASIFQETDIAQPAFLEELNKIANNPPIRLAKSDTSGNSGIEYQQEFRYKPRLGKRLFDIVVSGFALLIFSPVYGLIALLIRLESKGPIFYISKRVGAGYQIFDFYKFRTMIPDADKKLKQLSHLNQYAGSATEQEVPENTFVRCRECIVEGKECENLLYDDSGMPRCEKVFLEEKRAAKDTFFKISNDPRVTGLGKFLRNSSLDEIPQLFNVFKGDMSIVGNRPLPLYEAEKLTKDMFAKRFLAPAGITGLWQVTKRGKGGPMSEEERIELDNTYADHYGFWFDIKLILKTIPALFQKENV